METQTQLDMSMNGFRVAVNRFSEHPNLDTAQKANIASMDIPHLESLCFREDSARLASRMTYVNSANEYVDLVDICISQFLIMIPKLNGDAHHVDYYREQMDGRKDIIFRLLEQYGCYATSS